MGQYETIDTIKQEINLDEINKLLKDIGERSFTRAELAVRLDTCERSIGQHLSRLVYSGFLESERVYKEGKVVTVKYKINRQLIANIQNLLYYRTL